MNGRKVDSLKSACDSFCHVCYLNSNQLLNVCNEIVYVGYFHARTLLLYYRQ